jgi:hypothetical protein
VRSWAGLHPKQLAHPARGTRRTRPIVRGTVVLVEVSRLPRQTRKPRVLWLWWHGEGEPGRHLIWRSYVRRFDFEHTLRFLKQTLGWISPRPTAPGAGSPLDMARARRLLPTAAGARYRSRPPVALGASDAHTAAHTLPGAAGGFGAGAIPRDAGQTAKTVWPLARSPERASLRARDPLPSPQKGRLTADLFVPRRYIDAAPRRGPTRLG